MEFSRISARSAAMQIQLAHIDNEFESVKTADDLNLALAKTEELMLMETQEWVRLMSFADLENVG